MFSRVLQYFAVVYTEIAVRYRASQGIAVQCSALQCVALSNSVLQCVAACCSVLQCIAVRNWQNVATLYE